MASPKRRRPTSARLSSVNATIRKVTSLKDLSDDELLALANALRKKGVDVWFHEFELQIGDSIRQKINRGLTSAKLGIVVLSRAFLSKGWTNYELDEIMTRAVTGEQILLPIWHNITKQEVIEFSPSLADKVARSTATHSVEEIAQEISDLL